MANVLAIVAFVLGVVTTANSLVIWTAVLFPRSVRRARDRLATAPLLCVTWGFFAVVVAFGALVVVFPQRDAGFRFFGEVLSELSAASRLGRFSNDARILTHLSGWLALAPVMVWWVLGGAGLATLFADRVCPGRSAAVRVTAVACGGACTHFSYFLPFVGWFVFLPVVGCASVGAGFLAMFTGRSSSGTQQVAQQADRATAAVYAGGH